MFSEKLNVTQPQTQPETDGPILQELSALSDEFLAINRALNRLKEKTKPVCAPMAVTPPKNESTLTPVRSSSQVLDRLRITTQSAKSFAEEIDRIVSAIEL